MVNVVTQIYIYLMKYDHNCLISSDRRRSLTSRRVMKPLHRECSLELYFSKKQVIYLFKLWPCAIKERQFFIISHKPNQISYHKKAKT